MSNLRSDGTHTHADGTTHSHGPEPLYRGYAPRHIPGGRVHHGVAVQVPPMGKALYARLTDAFSAPFKGITTDGTPREGLCPLQQSGVSTAGIVSDACAYLAKLQRSDLRRVAVEPRDGDD